MICTTLFYKTHKDTGCQLKSCWHDRNSIELIRNSRLQGAGHAASAFLSRLCGGEVALIESATKYVFLSRLCGGEVELGISSPKSIFLSRLCGGEGYEIQYRFQLCFLSRLCGGEVAFGSVLSILFFLSRLCGGEDN